MKFNKDWLFRVYREEATGDKGGGGGGGEDAPTAEQFAALQAENEGMKTEHAAMQTKMDELLGETKLAKTAKREADEAARLAKEDKARKDGDFEQLFNSSEEKNKTTQTELDTLRSGIATEKRNNSAMKLAGELAEGVNAELLSEFIAPRLKYTDEGVKILDSNGQLTVSTLDDLKAEFQGSSRFASLLKGNQAAGGGATGGSGSGATSKTLSRTEFEALSPMKKMEFAKSAGAVVD